jgi:hypothetical protein
MRSSTFAPTIAGSTFSSAASSKVVGGAVPPTIFAIASALPPSAATMPVPPLPRVPAVIVCMSVAV